MRQVRHKSHCRTVFLVVCEKGQAGIEVTSPGGTRTLSLRVPGTEEEWPKASSKMEVFGA